MLFRRIVFYALLVGVLSGFVLTVVQFWQTIPIIHGAEVFEGESASAPIHEHVGQDGHAGHEHSAEEWEPKNGVERTAYTLLANILTAIGFSLVTMVAMVASARLRQNGEPPLDWRHGLVWGAAGYAVFWLMPALGLPPEIPGTATAPLEPRQLWWLFTVVCTAAGLAGLAFGKTPWRWVALGLLVVPYLVGAPHPHVAMFAGKTPEAAAALETLAQQFIGATAISNAVFWLVLGLASARAVRRVITSSGAGSPSEIESSSV